MSDTEDKKFYQTKNNKTAYIPNAEPTQKEKERLRAYGIDDSDDPSDELSDLLGEEFKGYEGQDAVNKLLQEKRGHVKSAFHRQDIGDIDLLWGNDFMGLKHIIKQRDKQGIDISEFMKDIASVIEEGRFRKKTNRGDFEFVKDGKLAVVAVEYHGNQMQYLLTAYKTRYK